MKAPLTILLFFFTSLAMAQPAESVNYEPQNLPLNNDGSADAYSCLSKDGLRLYFTRDNASDEIWKAERKSLTEEFKNPQAITIRGIQNDENPFSCWLTEDEKTLYYVTRDGYSPFTTSLYKAEYDETNNIFINPIKINFSGPNIKETSSIFISGPSLTPDLKQLFVYYNDEHSVEQIACFTSTDGLNYTFKSFLNDGTNYCPGSLADNGLSYYLTLREENNLLMKLTRPDLDSDFGNPEYFTIDSTINSGKNYYQPSVNSELGIISLTFGEGTWESNDLAIINLPTIKADYNKASGDIAKEVDTDMETLTADEEIVISKQIAGVDIDSTVYLPEYVWNFEVGDSTTIDSSLYSGPFHCTFGWDETKVVFLGESTSDDTLSFDMEDDFVTLVSNGNASWFNAVPNPASSSFHIRFNIKTNSNERPVFEMTNLNGQVVKRFELESTSGNFEIDITGLAEGLYLYRILTSDFVNSPKKLVVKR